MPLLFQEELLSWYDGFGRKGLPWKTPVCAYRIWVSEVMLQQTQVATVIPYFERFIHAFPNATTLANAPIDEVLSLWSGLGYYARARNLHKAAQIIRDQHGGKLPEDFNAMLALPGIGRSTAGAIMAQAFGARYPILDGNVKRVFARYFAIEGWTGEAAIEKQLWEKAESYTPFHRIADYTQAIMDLGATLCTKSKPKCLLCPLSNTCEANLKSLTNTLPTPRPKKILPVKRTVMLILKSAHGVLLQKRPDNGIWGGLYSFPEFDSIEEALNFTHRYSTQETYTKLPAIRHSFTHYHLDITPIYCEGGGHLDENAYIWYNDVTEVGVSAPVTKLLKREPT